MLAVVEEPGSILFVAQQVLEIANALGGAERRALDPQVGDVDQAHPAFRRAHHVAQVQRAEVHPLGVQRGDQLAQLRPDCVAALRVVAVELAEGLPR